MQAKYYALENDQAPRKRLMILHLTLLPEVIGTKSCQDV